MTEKFKGLKIVNADKDEIELGKWVSYRGVELRIARFNNSRYVKDYVDAIRNGNTRDDALLRAMSSAILTGWRDVQGETDAGEIVDVPYSADNSFELLNNDPITLDFVTAYCRSDANYVRAGFDRIKKK